MNEHLITLAIHTYDYAIGLCRLLENQGVKCRLENVETGEPLSSGVRIRINITDLPLALKIVETSMELAPGVASQRLKGVHEKVLIPVDFSNYSTLSVKAGFAFASMLGVDAVILNVFASPYFDGNLADSDNIADDLTDAGMRRDLEHASRLEMKRLERRVRRAIIAGDLPPVSFVTEVMEGVPEDAILQYARNSVPMLIVMATRGAHKKASQMIGSVAAEVIDSCRIPVFTVPENFSFTAFDEFREVAFFCNVDQQDLLAMDVFMRLMDSCKLHVRLVPVSDSAGSKLKSRLEALLNYCREHYPNQQFQTNIIPQKNFRIDFEQLVNDHNIQMIVVPNKKKNAFSRLFNPGIAHKIIFERDIPMLALPV